MDPIIDGIIAKLKQPQDFHIYNLTYCFHDDQPYHETVILETLSFQKNPSEEKLKETVGLVLLRLSEEKKLKAINKKLKSMFTSFLNRDQRGYDPETIKSLNRFISLANKIRIEGIVRLTSKEIYDYYFCGITFTTEMTLSLTKLSVNNYE